MSRKPTAFETRIYELARCIPRGSVTTYGELARAAGCGSAQAVGQALSRNPFAPVVPCHRVIASDMKPGGFLGQAAGERVRSKLDLLAEEGCLFAEGRLADPSRLFRFDR